MLALSERVTVPELAMNNNDIANCYVISLVFSLPAAGLSQAEYDERDLEDRRGENGEEKCSCDSNFMLVVSERHESVAVSYQRLLPVISNVALT